MHHYRLSGSNRSPPQCFITTPSFSPKLPNSQKCITPHLKTRPYQPSNVRLRPTSSQQERSETAASNYHKVDVFDQRLPPFGRNDHAPLTPVVIIPGYGATATEYYPMAELLRETLGPGAEVSVVPVTFSTWISTVGGRPITPVLRLLHEAVQTARKRSGCSNVHLVAHSAGGWIARIYLGHVPYPIGSSSVWHGARFVSKLVCLGTPHRSDEGVTRKNMQFVNENYPGAYHTNVQYVNIIGNGASVPEKPSGTWRFWETDWFTRVSYSLTDKSIGNGAAEGDGTFLIFRHASFNFAISDFTCLSPCTCPSTVRNCTIIFSFSGWSS
ncbi:lipase [Gracilaria domingensis]|nr:lipase [Gracilaria domingensis]